MEDKRGGRREGAGRKALGDTSKNRSMKATDEQWEIINLFGKKLKNGEISEETLRELNLIE